MIQRDGNKNINNTNGTERCDHKDYSNSVEMPYQEAVDTAVVPTNNDVNSKQPQVKDDAAIDPPTACIKQNAEESDADDDDQRGPNNAIQSSFADLWTTRSPPVKNERPSIAASTNNDDQSFALFAASFGESDDDVDDNLFADCIASPMSTPVKEKRQVRIHNRSQRHYYQNGSSTSDSHSSGIANNGIILPELKHKTEDQESDECLKYTYSDVSPIKLDPVVDRFETNDSNNSYPHHVRLPTRPTATIAEVPAMHVKSPFTNPQNKSHYNYSNSVNLNIAPSSHPLDVLHMQYRAFEDCQFLLPFLQEIKTNDFHLNHQDHIRFYSASHEVTHFRESNNSDSEDLTELKIAKRRVAAAICAFGGSVCLKHHNNNGSSNGSNNYNNDLMQARNQTTSSIFRPKGNAGIRQMYKQRLPSRYYLSDSRLSWDVEDNPPVWIQPDDDDDNNGNDDATVANSSTHSDPNNGIVGGASLSTKQQNLKTGDSTTASDNSVSLTDDQKMKYRCKMCGQYKQNHNCPFRQSVHRSIGVMVYPAVNSYTADEPGVIAPPLTKMNNFVSYEDPDSHQHVSPCPEYTQQPYQPMAQLSYHQNSDSPHVAYGSNGSGGHYKKTSAVTPEAFGQNYLSPNSNSTLSCQSDDTCSHSMQHHHPYHHPQYIIPNIAPNYNHHYYASMPYSLATMAALPPPPATTMTTTYYSNSSSQNKRTLTDVYPPSSIASQNKQKPQSGIVGNKNKNQSQFMASVALRPEHYRAVTTSKTNEKNNKDGSNNEEASSSCSYSYPVVPITFAERKRLSDTLFLLSKSVPNLTAQCADVLRIAREQSVSNIRNNNGNDLWDLAVAELLTQVVVVLYCSMNDARLDGLQRYLLKIGISC